MGKTKFRYNPETLSYEKVTRSLTERILRGLLFIAPTLILSLVVGFFIAHQIDSPRERRLQKELAEVNHELAIWQERLALIEEVTAAMQKRDEDLYRAALGAKEFPEELRLMGIGGSDRYKHLRNKSNADILVTTGKKLDEIESRLYAQSISFQELVNLAKDNEKRLANLPAIQPVRNKDLRKMVSGFGWRIDPVYGTRKMHWGLDFTGSTGTEIFATGGGVVEEVKTSNWGYGREVVINHGYGFKTRYAHLNAFKVKVGDKVNRGDVIGLMGNSGKSTGTHLHYEVEKDGQKVNPINYMHADLTTEEYEEILSISNNALKSMD
jgi:murein DD-endopeptidase MepM/ murein hydrolase activator NlpD